jgi:hypothetical protein
MKLESFLSILFVTLVVVASSHAWQNPAGTAGQRGPAAPTGIPPQVGPQVGIQGVSPHANRPPEGYQPPMAQPQEAQNAQDGWPHYPYPQYHNPYYEGSPNPNLLTYAVDWVLAVPSNAIEHFCNFLDRRVFPKMPATHGGNQQSAAPESPTDRVPQPLATPGGGQGSQPR